MYCTNQESQNRGVLNKDILDMIYSALAAGVGWFEKGVLLM